MSLIVTDSAASKLSEIITQQSLEPGHGLRIVAGIGGGCACSGPRFGMGFDAEQEGDTILSIAGIKFIMDADTAPQIDGASIDYVDDVMQQGFSIEAPNAIATGGACGCGGGGH